MVESSPSTEYEKEGLLAQQGEVAAGLDGVTVPPLPSALSAAPASSCRLPPTSDSTRNDSFSARPPVSAAAGGGASRCFSGLLLGVLPAVGEAACSGLENAEFVLTVSVLLAGQDISVIGRSPLSSSSGSGR